MSNKKCCVCGKIYKYCPDCKDDKGKPLYMAMYCSADCRDIINIGSDFEAGKLTKVEALKALEETDYKNKKFVSTSLNNTIKKLTEGVKTVSFVVDAIETQAVKIEPLPVTIKEGEDPVEIVPLSANANNTVVVEKKEEKTEEKKEEVKPLNKKNNQKNNKWNKKPSFLKNNK